MKRLLLLLFAMLTPPSHAWDLGVGDVFPSLTLPAIDGRTGGASTKDYDGERWMLHLFAAW